MCAKQWKSISAKGDNALKNDNPKLAIYFYTKSMSEAGRMINETILKFDGDTAMLGLYTTSCKLLVAACKKANKQQVIEKYIEDACNSVFDVIRNPGYPLLIRGKSIRAFEELFTIFKEAEPEKAYHLIGTKLYELYTYIQEMQPLAMDIQRN